MLHAFPWQPLPPSAILTEGEPNTSHVMEADRQMGEGGGADGEKSYVKLAMLTHILFP